MAQYETNDDAQGGAVDNLDFLQKAFNFSVLRDTEAKVVRQMVYPLSWVLGIASCPV